MLNTLILIAALSQPQPGKLGFIRVSDDHKGFVVAETNKPFVPWGFNYDHDEKGRLIEDYWDAEWPKIVEDFREMKDLGANVARIHLQVAKFLDAADKPNAKSLDQLARLVKLAEETGLYLDLTGLGCYHKKDVPAWYDALDESDRWAAQATFWTAIAERCRSSPAIFCYDLMNEPVVPGGKRKDRDWLGPAFGDKHFVQFITLDQANRPRPLIARMWVDTLVKAVRSVDKKHLVTVGLVDWSLDRPGLTSGFVPKEIAGPLDFLCTHIYPEAGKIDEAVETLRGFAEVGKPVLIEETFPLKCGIPDFEKFLKATRPHAAGYVGFYWGKTLEECRAGKTIPDAMMAAWLELFQRETNPTKK